MTLNQEINAWLRRTHHQLSDLHAALERQTEAARRLGSAREALEDTIAELWSEGSIEGKNKDERDARLRRLTAAERYALREAEDAYAISSAAVERARLNVARNREERHGLQMRVALLQFEPLEPVLASGGREPVAASGPTEPVANAKDANGKAGIIPLEPVVASGPREPVVASGPREPVVASGPLEAATYDLERIG